MLLNQASNKTHTQVSRERERESVLPFTLPHQIWPTFKTSIQRKKKEEKLIFHIATPNLTDI